MADVVSITDFRALRFARELDRARTVGDLVKIEPILRPGRDAGSISDLIAFAKTGAPPDCA
jgi:hypothetical protein